MTLLIFASLLLFVPRNRLMIFALISLLFAIAMNVAFAVSGLSKVAVCLGLSMICLATELELKPSVWRSC